MQSEAPVLPSWQDVLHDTSSLSVYLQKLKFKCLQGRWRCCRRKFQNWQRSSDEALRGPLLWSVTPSPSSLKLSEATILAGFLLALLPLIPFSLPTKLLLLPLKQTSSQTFSLQPVTIVTSLSLSWWSAVLPPSHRVSQDTVLKGELRVHLACWSLSALLMGTSHVYPVPFLYPFQNATFGAEEGRPKNVDVAFSPSDFCSRTNSSRLQVPLGLSGHGHTASQSCSEGEMIQPA